MHFFSLSFWLQHVAICSALRFLHKWARNQLHKLMQTLTDILIIKPLLALISEIVPLVAFVSALLITVFLPLAVAGAGRTHIKPGWRFAR